MVSALKNTTGDIAKLSLAFAIAGLVGGIASRGAMFLGLAVFGALCGVVLGLSLRSRRIGLVAALAGAITFMAGGALAFVVGMAAGTSLGTPDWYDALVPVLMGTLVGIAGGTGLVIAARGSGYTWRSVLGLALGFATAALICQVWLLSFLSNGAVSAGLPFALWGAFGGLGFGIAGRMGR